MGTGATFRELSGSKLATLKIPLPPLAIQQEIVAKLDAIFAEIYKATAAAEANAKNAEALFQSYLTEVFVKRTDTFCKKRFEEVCTLQRGFDLPTQDRKAGEFKLLSANGVTDLISEWKVEGPCVVTGRSGTIGKVHYVETNFWPLNTSLYVKNFFDNNKKYIYYFLTFFKLERYAGGAGVPTLNRNFLSPVMVEIEGNLDMQKAVVDKLDDLAIRTNYLSSLYIDKLNELSKIKQSILKKAFSGELVKE